MRTNKYGAMNGPGNNKKPSKSRPAVLLSSDEDIDESTKLLFRLQQLAMRMRRNLRRHQTLEMMLAQDMLTIQGVAIGVQITVKTTQ